MEDLIGKKLRQKGSNNIKVITNVQNGKAYFNDNGVIEISKRHEHFDYVENPISTPITPTYNPNINQSDTINPANFFNTSIRNTLLTEIEELQNNPVEYNKKVLQESREFKKPTIIGGTDVSHLSESTIRTLQMNAENDKKAAIEAKNDPWLAKQFDTNGKSKHFNSNAEELAYIESVNRGEIPLEPVNKPIIQNSGINITSNNTLAKMRRTNKIKLVIELNEMIPKAEDIKAVESVLDISLVEVLADEIAFKYLNDTELFKNLIISELERLVYSKKKPKKAIVKNVKADA